MTSIFRSRYLRIRHLLVGTFLVLVPMPARGEAPLGFETHVRPILKAHCFQCHGEEPKPKGGLDLRLVRAMVKGGISGEALVPARRDESLLWDRIEAGEMPPGEKKLSASEKATIAAWIDQGAKTLRTEPAKLPPGPVFTEEERTFWSFQPIRRPAEPKVRHISLVRKPVDAFLLAKLEEKGLAFSPEADRRTLIRRASFDLLGLPPTPEEVDAFVNDVRPDAYERLIDRLLESPHYGERWARHWLDVAGYADSDGDPTSDALRPYSYRYRDYLVRSLNADRPWDELVREQLAGDELLKPPYQDLSPADRDRLIATGFLRMAPDTTAAPAGEVVQARDDAIAETIKVVSTSLLGLTVGCAQCHSHRYDPISQEDYYRFRALFEPALDPANWRVPAARLVSLWSAAERQRAAEVDAEVAKIFEERQKKLGDLVAKVLERELAAAPAELRDKLRAARDTPEAKRDAGQKDLLKTYPRVLVSLGNVSLYDPVASQAIVAEADKKTADARAKRPADDYVHALTEVSGQVPVTHLLFRGNPTQPKQAVGPGELSLLASLTGATPIAADDPAVPTTGRRLAYARYLTGGKHPLLPRVLVNRVWMHHFGRGIVATPADFGALGERPTHPELLDWLADEFVRDGWSLKRLHRLVMNSTAYRQSSRRDPKLDAIDPDNRLLGRMPVRRLEAEALRDALLAASGRLNRTMYGPALPVAMDEAGQVLVGVDTRDAAGRQQGRPGSLGGAENRRSLYVQVRRTLPLSFMETFDAPTLTPNCERRASSTVAPQALSLMNNEFVIEQSEALAERVAAAAGADPGARARLAWRLALGSEPSAERILAAARFLVEQRAEFAAQAPKPPADPDRSALATFCQVLYGSNAFLYVD
ncbi:MAG: PSD1 and planctomycete cytochrome C domain-containing protein [Isosphaeraceae bacterium]|nr:PSD1 and planctomycete cytochrome C domain-containing protein [Isosphaeraceae bacterium]